MNTATIGQKFWNYCNVLRDDGMSYGDYVEQLTYLLFLKMADERSRPPYSKKSPMPADYDWASLTKKVGDELFDHCCHTLALQVNSRPYAECNFFKKPFQDACKQIGFFGALANTGVAA